MATCYFCGSDLIWGGDHTFDDYGLDGEGLVVNLSCPDCGATALFYSGEDEEEDAHVQEEEPGENDI